MPDSHEIPDIYCDGVQISRTPYDLMLMLTKGMPKAEGPNLTITPSTVGVIRMSLEHAKILAICLKRNLKDYESMVGRIPVHPETANNLGISATEDW